MHAKKILRSSGILLALALTTAVAVPTTSAESIPMPSPSILLDSTPQLGSALASPFTDYSKGIPVQSKKPTMSLRANYDLAGQLLNHTDTLTAADPSDFYFFSTSDPRSVIFRIQSANPNYRVDLYQIDWSTGTAYPANVSSTNGGNALAAVPVGDWGLRVTSTGTVGDTYTLQFNATAPGGTQQAPLKISSALQSVVWSYPNGDLYLNDTLIGNTKQANPHLAWKREFTFSSGGAYQSRTHNIDDVQIASITTRVKYTSSYASSDNAVLIVLNKGTLFTYFESQFQSGGSHTSSFYDMNGRLTPRRLDEIDLAGDPDILVYDLNTHKVIDFASNLNYYYAKGIEPSPSVVYYN